MVRIRQSRRSKHRFNGKGHAVLQHDAAIVCIISQHLRFFMEAATNTVSVQYSRTTEKTFAWHISDGGANGAQADARFHHYFDAQIQALCDAAQTPPRMVCRR